MKCLMWGSPPHTRGILDEMKKAAGKRGITPAYAENTLTCRSNSSASWDHPRIRGEYTVVQVISPFSSGNHPRIRGEYTNLSFYPYYLSGSPPHTRGILKYIFSKQHYMGITPAYAGNTGVHLYLPFLSQDHPRIRGEYSKVTFS